MRRKCPLCHEELGKSQAIDTIKMYFPNAIISDGVGGDDPDLDEHMAFGHGFNRAHLDNATVTARHYYRVVDEPLEIEGRIYNFGDMIEIKNRKVTLHVPGGIYPNSDVVKLSRKFSGEIRWHP